MTGQAPYRTAAGRAHGPGRGLALAVLVVAVAFAWGAASRVEAQSSWEPVVATAPGGSLNMPTPPRAAHLPKMVDPRFFPPPRTSAPGVRDPLPQGAWSPIVTGAIPRPQQPGASDAGGAPRTGMAANDGPTPIRPAPGGVVAAAPAAAPDMGGAGSPGAAMDMGSESDEGTHEGAAGGAVSKMPGPLDALPPDASAAQQYCFNTADTAADARFAWQARKIQEMEAELEKRAELLAAKTEEYKTWLARRDAFSRKAHEKLVGFYSRMRPDAAAVQLATLDEETAAAVMTKLETKVASQIMGEMDPVRAAKIAAVISGAARTPPAAGQAAGTTGGAPSGSADAAAPSERPES